MMKTRSVVVFSFFFLVSIPVSASIISLDALEGPEFVSLLATFDTVNISTGGSGGEDRLTEFLDTVLISTGGSGGEDRLSDVLGLFSISTGGSGGEDRLSDLFNEISISTGGSGGEDRLTDFFDTVFVVTETGGETSLSSYFGKFFVSPEAAEVLRGYSQYQVKTTVPEPSMLLVLATGLLGLVLSRSPAVMRICLARNWRHRLQSRPPSA